MTVIGFLSWLCVCVSVYVCMYVCIYIYTYIYIYIYMYIYIYIYNSFLSSPLRLHAVLVFAFSVFRWRTWDSEPEDKKTNKKTKPETVPLLPAQDSCKFKSKVPERVTVCLTCEPQNCHVFISRLSFSNIFVGLMIYSFFICSYKWTKLHKNHVKTAAAWVCIMWSSNVAPPFFSLSR